MDRALLVGINSYYNAPLMGAEGDAYAMARLLVDIYRISPGEIRILAGKRATKQEILSRLDWLVNSAKPGDRSLFYFSGHGVQIASRDQSGQISAYAEAICPVGFDGSAESAILDADLHDRLCALPPGSLLTWISDSCHSGDLWQDGSPGPGGARRFPLPVDLAWRVHTARSNGFNLTPLLRSDGYACDFEFLSSCGSDQESGEAQLPDINGQVAPRGVFTYHLLKRIASYQWRRMPLESLFISLARELIDKGFPQVPELVTSTPRLRQLPFLAAYPS